MFIDTSSIQIKKSSSNSYTDISSWLVEVKYQYNKLWDDGGRNLAGKQTGTLIGIFPKIILQFKKLSKTQLQTLVKIIDAPRQYIRYYDPYQKKYIHLETYTGDYEITNKSIVGENGHKNEGFSVSFIAISKR